MQIFVASEETLNVMKDAHLKCDQSHTVHPTTPAVSSQLTPVSGTV